MKKWILFSVAGLFLFVILYIIASLLYPGGTNADKTTKGFDWAANYWCELMGSQAKNGASNTAQPVALTAMFILCTGFSITWYYLPLLLGFNQAVSIMIRLTGILSMVLAVFIFTGYHDPVIYAAGVSAGIALAFTLIGFYRQRLYKLFITGLVCFLLLAVNNAIYITGCFLWTLAVLQKLSFLIVLSWVLLIGHELLRKARRLKEPF